MNAKERRKAERAAKQEAYEVSKTTATTSKVGSKTTAADAVGKVAVAAPVAAPASHGGGGGGSSGGGGGSTSGGDGSTGGGPAASAALEVANATTASSGSLFDGVPSDAPLPKLIVFDLDATLWYVVPFATSCVVSLAIADVDAVAAADAMPTTANAPAAITSIRSDHGNFDHSPSITLASLTLTREPELYQLRHLEGYQKCGKPGPVANTDVSLTEGGRAVLEALATNERFVASGCKLAVASRNTKGPWAEQLLKDFEIQGKSLDERIMFKEIYQVRSGIWNMLVVYHHTCSLLVSLARPKMLPLSPRPPRACTRTRHSPAANANGGCAHRIYMST